MTCGVNALAGGVTAEIFGGDFSEGFTIGVVSTASAFVISAALEKHLMIACEFGGDETSEVVDATIVPWYFGLGDNPVNTKAVEYGSKAMNDFVELTGAMDLVAAIVAPQHLVIAAFNAIYSKTYLPLFKALANQHVQIYTRRSQGLTVGFLKIQDYEWRQRSIFGFKFGRAKWRSSGDPYWQKVTGGKNWEPVIGAYRTPYDAAGAVYNAKMKYGVIGGN
jgi:hypothetical protein